MPHSSPDAGLRPRELEQLREIELLKDLSDDDIQRLAAHLERVEVPAGSPVFTEGSAGNAWYILLEGNVAILRRMPTGPRHELALLHPGECFGEMALLDDAPRMVTAEVVQDAVLARLSRDTFNRIVDAPGTLGAHLLRSMSRVICERQRELTWVLQQLVDFDETASPEQAALARALQKNLSWQ